MSVRASVATFAAMAAVGLIALLIVASSDERTTAFSLDIPPEEPIAYLAPHQHACQGPLRPPASFQGVRAYLSPAASPALPVTIRDRAGETVARGDMPTRAGVAGLYASRLTTPVAAHGPVEVCFTNPGPGVVAVLGASATATSGVLHVGSGATRVAMVLVFQRPHPETLLSLIPTLFSRAALFKASWVGAWTFWALCALVLAGFVLAGGAVALAAADQDPESGSSSPPQRNRKRTARQ